MKKKILITVVIAVVFLGTAVVFAVNNNKNDEKTSKSEVVKTESPKEDASKVQTSPKPETPIATQRSAAQSQTQAAEPEPQPEVVKPTMSIAVAGTRLYVSPNAGTHPVATVSVEFNGQVQNGPATGSGIPVQFTLPAGSGVVNVTVTDTVGNSTTQSQQIN